MKPAHVIVIGAGPGGLTAAITLARAGVPVRLLEARPQPGGLASGFVSNGISFDTGPYILFEREELQWAFSQLGLELADEVELKPVHNIYQVTDGGGDTVSFYSSLERTADEIDEQWPGAGNRYCSFVQSMQEIYRSLAPMQSSPNPHPIRLLASAGSRHVPFLLKSLDEVMATARLPGPVADGITVWSHVTGVRKEEAPSPLALLPAVMHQSGAFYPDGGMAEICKVLARYAMSCGVELQFNARVSRIGVRDGSVRLVETTDGRGFPSRHVISDCGALFTYLMLVDGGLSRVLRTKLNKIPLQSPGVCAYLSVKGPPQSPYLRFQSPGGRSLCRLLVRPSAIDGIANDDQWQAARLIAPIKHHEAERLGRGGQAEFLASILSESWWRESITEFRLLATRTPTGWGHEFGLYRDSINPLWNVDAIRHGRMQHRSPYIKGLYLSGSSTHPGPRVSLCAISGILAARRLLRELQINNSEKLDTGTTNRRRPG